VEQTGTRTEVIYPQPPADYDPTSEQHLACLGAGSDGARYGTPSALGPCASAIFSQIRTENETRIAFSDFARREVVTVTWIDDRIVTVSRTPLDA
jgi:hypothetical protein